MKQWMVHLTLIETDQETSATTLAESRKFVNVAADTAFYSAPIEDELKEKFVSAMVDCTNQTATLDAGTSGHEQEVIPIAFVKEWHRVMHGGREQLVAVDDPQEESDSEADEDQTNPEPEPATGPAADPGL